MIADYTLADKKPGGRCYYQVPGAGLDKVFGIEREQLLVLEDPVLVHENSLGLALNDIIDVVSAHGAEVVEEYQEEVPLITKNAYGKGNAIYFTGTFFKSYYANPTPKKRARFLEFLKEVGITPNCSLLKADNEEKQSPLITTTTFDKATGKPAVVLVSNTKFGVVCDTLKLPCGNWVAFEAKDGQVVKNDDMIQLKLGSHESVTFINQDVK